MRNNIKKTFKAVEESIGDVYKEWSSFQDKIREQLPAEYHSELESLNSQFQVAISELVKELSEPVLTIATTGTTSGGKSTLVNFLCGTEIVPVAVEEKSAGIVTIEYSEKKALKIDQTPGALWKCGEWDNVTDKDIYDRLDEIMKSYLQAKRDGKSGVACPQTTVYYPFRLVADPNLLDLPQKTKVRIMDLPGLAHVNDDGNASVIRKCKEALCIVTYNSEETDPQKVNKLLQEVVDQVKELGGSPARMLFVLNRIDAFRKNKDWPDSEREVYQSTVYNIKEKLTQELEEYKKEISALEVIKMSAWPALLSIQMKNENEQTSIKASETVDDFFSFLIPKSIQGDLARLASNWDLQGRQRVSEAIWEASYAEDFHKYLKEHVDEHFPQLVIPQIVDRFKAKVGNAVAEWAVQTTYAFINSSEEEYQKESENISRIRTKISQFISNKSQELRDPFEQIENSLQSFRDDSGENSSEENQSSDTRTDLEKIVEGIIDELEEGDYKERANSLRPVYRWRRGLEDAVVNGILTPALESLDQGNICLDSEVLQAADPDKLKILEGVIRDLIDLEYRTKNGKKIEARTQKEKHDLNKLNRKLNELASALNGLMNEAVQRILDLEMRAVGDGLNTLLDYYLSILEEGMGKIAPNLAISFSRSKLGMIDNIPAPKYQFEAGFAVQKGTWLEDVTVTELKRTLIFFKRKVKKIKKEQRSSDNAQLPAIEDINKDWILQKNQAEIEIFSQVADWLISEINKFIKEVESSQKEIVDRYQERLDKAHDQAKLSHQRDLSIWNPLHQEAKRLEENIKKAGKVLR